MARYAAETEVSSDRSIMEIKSILQRYGATRFAYGEEEERAIVGFDCEGRRIRFVIPLPDRSADEFWMTPEKRRRRTPEAAAQAYEQATRQRWRALALVIKAKLEAVASGVAEFETEFLAHIVLPNGGTVGDWARPQIRTAYETGTMPPLLGMGGDNG